MGLDDVIVVTAAVLLLGTFHLVLLSPDGRLEQLLARLGHRWRTRHTPPAPPARSIEDVAHDVRRLAGRYRTPVPGTRHAKLEGLRRAYDGVLAEACGALEVEHLLGVLPPGPDLDAERHRVERCLAVAGLVLEPPLVE